MNAPAPDDRLGAAALVLFSGGQDSTTCLYWAKEKFDRVEALGFDYGQRHAVELAQAVTIAALAGVPYTVLDLRGTLSGSALTEAGGDVNAPHAQAPELPASFVPGRNAVFLAHAAAFAFTRGIRDSETVHLVGGMCQTDYSGYPDCRLDFVQAMARALGLALGTDPGSSPGQALRIHTPLMHLTKAETWRLAADLGCLDVVVEHSHTDYHGDRSERHPWGYGRLDNPASVLRAKGYEEARAKGWI